MILSTVFSIYGLWSKQMLLSFCQKGQTHAVGVFHSWVGFTDLTLQSYFSKQTLRIACTSAVMVHSTAFGSCSFRICFPMGANLASTVCHSITCQQVLECANLVNLCLLTEALKFCGWLLIEGHESDFFGYTRNILTYSWMGNMLQVSRWLALLYFEPLAVQLP